MSRSSTRDLSLEALHYVNNMQTVCKLFSFQILPVLEGETSWATTAMAMHEKFDLGFSTCRIEKIEEERLCDCLPTGQCAETKKP
jgi:hypothetical protein